MVAAVVNSNRAVNGPLAPPELRILEASGAGSPIINPIDHLTVDLLNVFNKNSVEDGGNWELRFAGEDGQFDTADDTLISLAAPTNYMIGTNEIEFSFPTLLPGSYRFTAVSGGLMDPFGTSLDGDGDGDGDGTSGDNFVQHFTVTSEIRGMTFDDVNGNATHDAGEPALGNWTAFIDRDLDGQFDALNVEPDDFREGQELTGVNSNVSLSVVDNANVAIPGATVTANRPAFASTGTHSIGSSLGSDWSNGERLRIDFAVPVHLVSIDAIADGPERGLLLQFAL